jgi:predicted nucleotidyltransferase
MNRYGLPDMFEVVFRALNASGVRYLVAGGVAVVLHGYTRLTEDLDLVVDLHEDQASAAVEALTGLGLRPRLPVDPLLFADAGTRQSWVRERGMTVFTFLDPDNPMLVVDLFADPPDDFDELWRRAEDVRLATTTVKIVSVDDLIIMKRRAGRPMDLIDIDELQRLQRLKETDQ